LSLLGGLSCRGALVAVASLAMVVALAPDEVIAGPPYVTDDPEPTEKGHWEVFGFLNGSHVTGETAGQTGLDINYGAAKDLQLTLVVPVGYEDAAQTRAGMGVVEVAAKYKVLHQRDGSVTPDVSLFPRLLLPMAGKGFGSSRVNVLLPVWMAKDAGDWSVFGGGGYQINPGAENRNFWTGGVAVERAVTDRWALGVEVYGHTKDASDGLSYTGVNVGVRRVLTEHWSFLASAGPGLRHARQEGAYNFYVSLKADYR
jgi:hypothetical protein